MTKLGSSTTICILVFAALIFAGSSCAPKGSSVAEPIAKAYGLDSFGQIDTIRYTFNIDIPGLISFSHKWEWNPKTNTVTYEGKDKDGNPMKVTYQRSQVSSQSDAVKNQVDPAFVNDNYWLIFPFHAYWDSGANVQDKGMQALPIGSGSAKLVSVAYPSNVGYTPGDTWNLYVGEDNRIEQLLFQHGGTKKPSVVKASWEGYKKAGPLLVSTEHKGTADGAPFHLSFSDVAVKLTGSDTWMNAQ